ncbi:hypothetical protein OV203_47120 [Nannocystis sp. ILAH1]|nr:hypothetical protein [Nannocystis sp. ILAH1]MCY0994789.1 hypothetical protein [Nannocystis sp. ILAH1]
MNKIKLVIRGGFDGQTPVTQPPTFRLVEGWNEAELTAPAGILPAGLWGQVPAGDPYLLHANLLTTDIMNAQSSFDVRTGAPMQVRAQFTPYAGNTRLTLVRPSDALRIFTPPQALVKLEMLVESIGGTNELGSRLYQWAESTISRANSTGVRVAQVMANATLAAWTGVLHVIYNDNVAGSVNLPPLATVPTDAVMTFTRKGGGVPTILPAAGETFGAGVNVQAVTRSGILMNNSEQWVFAGS